MLFIAVIVGSSWCGRAADSVTETFQKALFEEEANQNYDAAMRAYRDVVARMDEQRKLAATAVFRLGECYRKLGQTNEAFAQYQRIVREFPDQPTLVNLSRQNLVGLGAAPASTAGASSGQPAGAAPRTAELDSLKEQQHRAREEYERLDHLLAELRKQSSSELKKTLPMLQPDSTLAKLLEQDSTAEQRRTELAQQFTANHPEVKAVDAVIKLIDEQIADRLKGILSGLEIQRALAAKRMDQLQKQYNEVRDQAVVEAGMTPALSQAARLEQKRLLEEEIKLAEQEVANLRVHVANGVAPKDSTIPKEREILALRRQLAALDVGPATTSTAAGTEAGATDEEDKEIRRIQAMIKNSPDLINAPGPDNVTPLESAARKGQVVVARFLLDNKADPNFRARYGNVQLPLTAAAFNGHKALVELLLSHGAQVDAASGEALRLAATKGFKSVVESLLTAKANPNVGDHNGETALHRAVMNRFPAIAELLIKNGADVNAVNRVGKPEDNPNQVAIRQADGTPLHIAASQGDVAMVSLLLSNRADVNAVNFLGETPLHVSASQLPIVTNLLAAGADVNRAVADGPFKGWTPLLYAVSWNGTNAAKALLQAGADPNAYAATVMEPPANRGGVAASGGRIGYTPLLMAVAKKQPAMVNLLLENKADPNKETPLERTVDAGDLASTRALLGHGAEVNVMLENGETPLTTAVLRANDEIVRLLLEHKADVNAKAKDGLTALHKAVNYGRKAIVETLLAAKADVNLTDARGLTPLNQLGVPANPRDDTQKALVALLREHGAKDAFPELAPDPNVIRVWRQGLAKGDVVFTRDNAGVNRFTVMDVLISFYGESRIGVSGGVSGFGTGPRREYGTWWPVGRGSISSGFPAFPDLSKLKIRRTMPDGTWQKIPVNLTRTGGELDCTRDVDLQFGDVIEIPERDHPLNDPPVGLTDAEHQQLLGCLQRRATIVFKGTRSTLPIPPGNGRYLSKALTSSEARSILTTSADLTRVKVVRQPSSQPVGKAWTDKDVLAFRNSGKPLSEDLALADGDIIEVPDK